MSFGKKNVGFRKASHTAEKDITYSTAKFYIRPG